MWTQHLLNIEACPVSVVYARDHQLPYIIAVSIHIKPNAITDVSIDDVFDKHEVGDKNSCLQQQRPHLVQSARVQHIISTAQAVL